MDTYIPKRLIDTNLILQLMKKNNIQPNKRLISFETPISNSTPIPININFKLEKKIEKMKDNILYEMTPSIINGLLFISVSLLIYFVLYYKYNKKKNEMIKESNK